MFFSTNNHPVIVLRFLNCPIVNMCVDCRVIFSMFDPEQFESTIAIKKIDFGQV